MSDTPPVVIFASISITEVRYSNSTVREVTFADAPHMGVTRRHVDRWPSHHQPATKGHFIDTFL